MLSLKQEVKHYIGAIIGADMVLLYFFSGGLRASIWTDEEQLFVMIFSMGLLFFITDIPVVATWRVLGLNGYIYEVFPGILSGFLIFSLSRLGNKESKI